MRPSRPTGAATALEPTRPLAERVAGASIRAGQRAALVENSQPDARVVHPIAAGTRMEG